MPCRLMRTKRPVQSLEISSSSKLQLRCPSASEPSVGFQKSGVLPASTASCWHLWLSSGIFLKKLTDDTSKWRRCLIRLAATSLAGIMRTTSTPFGSAHVRCTWSREDSSRQLRCKHEACECAGCSLPLLGTSCQRAIGSCTSKRIGMKAASQPTSRLPSPLLQASRLSIHSGLRWRSSANTNARSPGRNLLSMASGLGDNMG